MSSIYCLGVKAWTLRIGVQYRSRELLALQLKLLSFSGALQVSDEEIYLAIEPQAESNEELVDPQATLEQAVKERPDDARALVALANHYWLIGAGPEVVGDLASRAIAADPENRAGWHLWALAESNPRERVARWQQVSKRFPADDLAKANLADNAASLAGAEQDYEAVDLAIVTYEELLATATHSDQRSALEKAIRTLKGWKF